VKLSAWAKENGVSYRSALNWFHAGTLPVPAQQLATGTILVDPPVVATGVVVAYCRVSSHEQKADLERHAGRGLTACSERGIRIDRTVTEVGWGREGRRGKLRTLLADATVSTIVVKHRGRFACSGMKYLDAALMAHGRTVVVLDDAELPDGAEVPDDLSEVLTALCSRLYGRGSAARRTAAAVVATENEPACAPGDRA
jgi:putative resolvase